MNWSWFSFIIGMWVSAVLCFIGDKLEKKFRKENESAYFERFYGGFAEGLRRNGIRTFVIEKTGDRLGEKPGGHAQ